MTVEIWRNGIYVKTIRLNRSTGLAVIRMYNRSVGSASGSRYLIVSNGLRN